MQLLNLGIKGFHESRSKCALITEKEKREVGIKVESSSHSIIAACYIIRPCDFACRLSALVCLDAWPPPLNIHALTLSLLFSKHETSDCFLCHGNKYAHRTQRTSGSDLQNEILAQRCIATQKHKLRSKYTTV